MSKRYIDGAREWCKIGWPVAAAMLCSIGGAIAGEGLIDNTLDILYICFMGLYIYNIIGHNKVIGRLRDQATWVALYSYPSGRVVPMYFIPTESKSRVKRLWHKLRKQTRLKLFHGEMEARSPTFPYPDDSAIMYSSRQHLVVGPEQFFRMKLAGLVETTDLEKVKNFLKDNKTTVPADFFELKV